MSQPAVSSTDAMVVSDAARRRVWPPLVTWLRSHERLILITAIAVLVCLWLWDVEPGGELRRAELGTIAEAIGGLATAATLGYLILDRRRAQADLLQAQNRQQEQQRRLQASQVTAWCVEAAPERAVGVLKVRYRLEIHNASDSAIYSASAIVGESFGKRQFVGGSAGVLSVIPPGQSQVVETTLGWDADGEPSFPPPILLQFTDAAGRVWWRHPEGELQEYGDHARETLVPWWDQVRKTAPGTENPGTP